MPLLWHLFSSSSELNFLTFTCTCNLNGLFSCEEESAGNKKQEVRVEQVDNQHQIRTAGTHHKKVYFTEEKKFCSLHHVTNY